ncbi:hypothetical protein D1610_11720 [Sphingomonas gilva]|uniref:Uncharacterized protein n=1 Tax=Sphingomonas gilva TaxID=2305907 RepID=A0A396RLK7_9SPHN|nr:hypothetical protein [Sphingomonas gilva]RHW17210.1 hypothetical protein D1610_11720 [Sphingomonas gilva]
MSGRIDWEKRALRAEDQLVGAKVLARKMWRTLKARTGWEAEAMFKLQALKLLDATYDAAEAVWEQHRIYVEPCRRILTDQGEMYLGHWPDGTTRNLTRAQLLMMGGQPMEEAA